jgi:hypothetical protein
MATTEDTSFAKGKAPVAEPDVNLLEDDPIGVPGQTYVLISVVGPTSRQKSEKCGVKIRGVFATRAEADSHAKKLQKLDPTFDIFCADMGKWLMIPPDPTAIDDQHYAEDYLNTLIQSYKENQAMARQHFEERKRSVMQDGLDKNLLPDERLPMPPMRPGVLAQQEANADTDLPSGSKSLDV